MNRMLFNEYISTILLPYIARVRSNPRFENEPAVLLMETYLAHMHDDTLKELAVQQVKVATFLPHTTNIFLCLDLSLLVFSKRG
jgi:hypothetical protein